MGSKGEFSKVAEENKRTHASTKLHRTQGPEKVPENNSHIKSFLQATNVYESAVTLSIYLHFLRESAPFNWSSVTRLDSPGTVGEQGMNIYIYIYIKYEL